LWALEAAALVCRPGSLYQGSSQKIMAWMETRICRMVDLPGSQLGPVQVPRRERQTVCEKRC
jgi:hypothetical protein